MIATLVAGLGIALFLEGLVFALAPSRLEDLVAMIARMPLETRRLLGLAAMFVGVAIVALAVAP